jgi:hypothetical protein
MDPSPVFVKAHFYSPAKRIFGLSIDTYWVNVLVIWAVTVITYILLYFWLLRNILGYGEKVLSRRPKLLD